MLFGERYINNVLPSTLELLAQESENTMCRLFLSREDDDFFEKRTLVRPVSKKGYVQDGLEEALNFLGDSNISVFLCGHPAMVDDVRAKLVEIGIDAAQIKFEKY
jgi:sulfite reductase alpha subunit-like flavoprotein